MASAWAAELAAAVEIAERAGVLVVGRLDDAGDVAYKGVRDIVTEVDHASEALIRAALAEGFPDDAFYGEESGRDAAAAHRTWVCDPIDGTVNYANGIPFFCVSLALVVDGHPVAGVVYDPLRRAIRIPRQMGSAALALSYVANGRFDAYSQTVGLSPWDITAAGLIAERAGATVTNMAGGPWFDLAAPAKGVGLLAAPPAHHPRLLELLREPG